jgi:hypothetical protein
MKLLILLICFLSIDLHSQSDFVCGVEDDDSVKLIDSQVSLYKISGEQPKLQIEENEKGLHIIDNTTGKYVRKNLLDVKPNFSEHFSIKNQNNKWGVIDFDGNTIVDEKYDDLYFDFTETQVNFVVKQNGKWGILNSKGANILPIKYDIIKLVNKEVAMMALNNDYYLYVFEDETIIDIKDFCVNFFKSDTYQIFQIRKNDKIGLMDKDGNIIIEPKYDDVSDFRMKSVDCGQIYKVRENSKTGLIDECGNFIFPLSYNSIININRSEVLHDAILEVSNNYKKYIYYNGKMSSFSYKEMKFVNQASSGLIVFSTLNKFGLYDIYKDEVLIDPVYDDLVSINDTIFAAKKNGLYGLISIMNKILTEFKYDLPPKILNFNSDNEKEIRIKVRSNGLYGVINEDFDEVVKPTYHKMAKFSYDYILVMRDHKWGYLDSNFEIGIDLSYDFATSFFSSGKAIVVLDGKEFFIDTDNNCIENCN